MPKVVTRDGKTQLVDNTDTVVLELGTVATITAPSTAAALTVSAGAGKFGYGQTQANAIALAVKKLVTIVKANKTAT
jgi:hypothetical protein